MRKSRDGGGRRNEKIRMWRQTVEVKRKETDGEEGDKWMNGRTGGRADRWMNGRTGGRADRLMN